MTVDEIALMVVYVVRSPDDEMLLRLHLDRIARHTAVPYRIHAATPRITERGTEMLRADPHVELCPTSPSTDLGSREHAHHLDQLLERVRAGDASHVATLDLDSFPVADRWHDTLALCPQ
jgi:hypothetical protein